MEIILANGLVTQVSDIDYDYLSQYSWSLSGSRGKGYAARSFRVKASVYQIAMHLEIIQRMNLIIPTGYEADHKDRDTLNNNRGNLRVITLSLNRHNTDIQCNNTSGVRGISYDKRQYKWIARISIEKERIFLGAFNIFELAVEARLKAEERYLKALKD